MKLTEIKGERAITILADLIDPIKTISTDEIFRKKLSDNRLDAVKYLLKNHSKTVITILALINEEDPKTYEPNILTLPVLLLDFFNDPMVTELFGLQSQISDKTSSGSATENTEARKA